ncbi:hypothetical protein A2110_03050 [Candidatus Jorgensenbacteria bacterium GWA1_54_12]|uniref:Methyltransferase FkbM domain-containing protein n=1 Tax=Candidatus Jorgensenbacteria bacterium GWA1_54_12 TaxID=1798468 RepID=A0A1F6BKS5_9BACT|nr:MAG: Methyltransferase, FkbM family [Candidatus Jorgensenbacteria bacterium GW2011_GWB1_49_9]OGG37536.1 MAG: hypothetical protein A2110_03050 [Candidatus Jorgensenbacteria bacterium GWA1_54_12]
MNPFSLKNTTFLGKLARLPLKLIPPHAVVRILQGAGRGLKWIKGSGNNSYWLGTYEADKQKAIKETLKKGMVFYDLGAHVGIFTLLAATTVGERGLVIAFEPSERNISYLEKHIILNGFGNIAVKKGAVAKKSGSTRFKEGGSSAGGHISDGGTVVRTYSIDELVVGGLRKPDVVKIDVQGATLLALQGMERTLKEGNIKLFIAIDNTPRAGIEPFTKRDVHNFLKSAGYTTVGMNGEKVPDSAVEEVNEIIAYKAK